MLGCAGEGLLGVGGMARVELAAREVGHAADQQAGAAPLYDAVLVVEHGEAQAGHLFAPGLVAAVVLVVARHEEDAVRGFEVADGGHLAGEGLHAAVHEVACEGDQVGAERVGLGDNGGELGPVERGADVDVGDLGDAEALEARRQVGEAEGDPLVGRQPHGGAEAGDRHAARRERGGQVGTVKEQGSSGRRGEQRLGAEPGGGAEDVSAGAPEEPTQVADQDQEEEGEEDAHVAIGGEREGVARGGGVAGLPDEEDAAHAQGDQQPRDDVGERRGPVLSVAAQPEPREDAGDQIEVHPAPEEGDGGEEEGHAELERCHGRRRCGGGGRGGGGSPLG